MGFLDRLLGAAEVNSRAALRPLYAQIVEKARSAHWYVDGAVEDSVNGRFEMVATLLSLVLLRLERDPNCKQEGVHLTELFVDDMDPQLREFGVGDMIVGKHIGKLMSALGGRLGVLRDALNSGGGLAEFIGRNLYRGEARLLGQTQFLESALVSIVQRLASADTAQLIAGKADW